ncbi:hypothetical protein K435DRAFT_697428 [Dendrothele bispora CBS 962.96]|uniref:DDE-1 domain-containing protein n=1 Tax=Dendrothele bispora (strain CBS 962.96) TaxID=1314807 RepID=A0A4S8KVS9_DENBC|nr:hypothetical protein K435DRAFT_697428 [Dendrothele bispora CBS 962.96]
MIGIITKTAPELFDIELGDGTKFRCSETFVRRYLRNHLKWSLRTGTRAAQKLPPNYEELLKEAFLREALFIRNYNIPAALRVNTDQTQSVYAPSTKMTWNQSGVKQVDISGHDEKRAFTLVPSISASGEVLPMQAIYKGGTAQSCPNAQTPAFKEAKRLGFLLEPSKMDTYWSNIDTMKNLVSKIIAPYFERTKKQLDLSDAQQKSQYSMWKIDCWSVHRSEEFLTWMKENHPQIIILFVPGSCTGVFQPLDVGVQRVMKLSIKRSAHRDLVAEVVTLLDAVPSNDKERPLKLDQSVPTLRNRSLGWIVNAYHDINNPDLIKKVCVYSYLSNNF